jgi:hypothetical protein
MSQPEGRQSDRRGSRVSTFCTLTFVEMLTADLLLQNRHSRVNASVDHQQQTTQSMEIVIGPCSPCR